MKLVEVKHPLVKHKLGVMREADIDTKNSVNLQQKWAAYSPMKRQPISKQKK